MKHWTVPHKNSAPWDKKVRQNRDIYYPKIFRYQNNSEIQRSPYENFRYCQTKKIDKIVLPLNYKKNFKLEQFRNTEWFAHVVFLRFRTNNSRRKDVTPPSLSIVFSILETSSNTERFAHDLFRRSETKKLPTVKRDTHPLIPNFFPY